MMNHNFVNVPTPEYSYGVEFWDVNGSKSCWFTNPGFRDDFISENRKSWSKFYRTLLLVNHVSKPSRIILKGVKE